MATPPAPAHGRAENTAGSANVSCSSRAASHGAAGRAGWQAVAPARLTSQNTTPRLHTSAFSVTWVWSMIISGAM